MRIDGTQPGGGAERPARQRAAPGRVAPASPPPTSAEARRRASPLRLVRPGLTDADARAAVRPRRDEPITDPMDPRWVLAVRVAAELQGEVLTPERRQRVARFGTSLGLTAFDTSLIIAIVQDQARRGYAPEYCPTAGEPQLRMIPVTKRVSSALRRRLSAALLLAAILATELLVLAWLFG